MIGYMIDIAILGAGGHAKEVAFLIEEINNELPSPQWNIIGYFVANPSESEQATDTYNGKYAVIGHEDSLIVQAKPVAVALAVGDPQIARKIYQKFCQYPFISFPNLIHPRTIMDKERVQMGQGNIICAGNVFTTDIRIGDGNCFNRSSTYGHDIVIGNYSIMNPAVTISGGVDIGDACLIGTGATVLQYLSIGHNVIVGAGAVVTEDVLPDTTVIGVPAKPLTRTT